jgi:hypothetical protein
MYAQCNLEGRQYLLMDSIVNYKSYGHTVKFANRHITVNGRQHLWRTTMGWPLCVLWKDGSTSWVRLADLKESNPIEVAEYAISQVIDHEPAFAWWSSHTLKKHDHIIALVNKKVHKEMHKFGIRVPSSIPDDIAIDKVNGDML